MLLPSRRLHARTLLRASRNRTLSTSSVRSLSSSTPWSASWWDIGNMGNYGQPGHYEQPANGAGSGPKDHVARSWNRRNVLNEYSRDGREAKMRADELAKVGILDMAPVAETGGSAISQKDLHACNMKAQGDHPEAPDPVIGMNDERGASGTINDPLGDSMRGLGTKNVPHQSNEMLMKWRISEESIREASSIGAGDTKTIPPSTRGNLAKWEISQESIRGGPTGRLDD